MLAVASIPFLAVGAVTFANTSDDPLITLRYASNLLRHGQPVFNLGVRVEGYTSPLHLLLATALLMLPGGAALLKLKLASLIFAAGSLWQTARLSREVGLPRWAQLAVMLAVAGSWNFMLSASNGLETSLVAFLATGAAASLASQDSTRGWWRPAIWTGLLALSRPEAVLLIGALAAVALCSQRTHPRRIYWLAGPVVALGMLLTFRVMYYGDLLPNTYFAKQLSPGVSISSGLSYLLSSQPLSALGLGVVVLTLEIWLICVGARRFLRVRPGMGYALAVVVAQALFVLGSGGDWMKGGRFLVPAIPAAAILVFSGVEAVLVAARRSGAVSRRSQMFVVLGAAAVLVAPVGGSYLAPVWGLTRGVGDRSLIAEGNYPLSPIWVTAVNLADCLSAGQSVAYSEAGLFGYEHPDLRLIDTRGLTNIEIARDSPSAEKHPWGVTDPNWFRPSSTVGRVLLSSRPQMIISFDDSAADWPSSWILDGRYRRSAIIPEPSANRTLLVYLRRGFVCSSS